MFTLVSFQHVSRRGPSYQLWPRPSPQAPPLAVFGHGGGGPRTPTDHPPTHFPQHDRPACKEDEPFIGAQDGGHRAPKAQGV